MAVGGTPSKVLLFPDGAMTHLHDPQGKGIAMFIHHEELI
jgi:hypothetical protein